MCTKETNRGFTLVELVLYIAFIGGIFLVLTSIVVSGNRAVQNRTVSDALFHSEQRIFRSLYEDVGLSTAQSDAGGELELTVPGDDITYRVVSGVLERVRGSETVVLTEEGITVESYQFSVLSGGGVSVGMVLGGGRVEETLEITGSFYSYE